MPGSLAVLVLVQALITSPGQHAAHNSWHVTLSCINMCLVTLLCDCDPSVMSNVIVIGLDRLNSPGKH